MLDEIDLIREIDDNPAIYQRDVAEALERLECNMFDCVALGWRLQAYSTQRGQRPYHIISIFAYHGKEPTKVLFDSGFYSAPIRMEKNLYASDMLEMVRQYIDDYGYTSGMIPPVILTTGL